MNLKAAALSNQTRLKTMLSAMESRLEEVTASCQEMRRESAEKDQAVETARQMLEREEALQREKTEAWQETTA